MRNDNTSHAYTNIIRKLVLLLYPLIFTVTTITLTLNSFKYSGFVEKHLSFELNILWLISVIGFSIYIYLLPIKTQEKITLSVMRISALIVGTFLALLFLDHQIFQNFSFSRLHLNLTPLGELATYFSVLSAQLIIINPERWILEVHLMVNKISGSRNAGLIIIFCSLSGVIFVNQLTTAFVIIQDGFTSMVAMRSSTAEEKRTARLGGFMGNGWIVPYTKFIVNETPSDALILIPPQQAEWSLEGNAAFLRWFVYPRSLVSAKDSESLNLYNADYVLIAHGTGSQITDPGWPAFELIKEDVKRVVLIDRHTLEKTTEYNSGYIPDPTKEEWGIIELER